MSKENKYYVYLHRSLDGTVFYVGKGTANRYKSNGSRSEQWKNKASQGYTYQIIQENLSNRDAVLLECELIKIYRSTAVNSTSSKIVKELSFEELSAVFYYDETSPSGLRWKTDRFKNKGAKVFSAGDVAGNKRYLKNGRPRCWRVSLGKKVLLVHRIIWLLANKTIDPDLVIDHKDGNAFNNNILNLKEKTFADNARNKGYSNKDLMVGVTERFDPKGIPHFRASWRDENGKPQCKNFSTRKYGREEAYQLACNIRRLKIEELRMLGFDYTDRHLE